MNLRLKVASCAIRLIYSEGAEVVRRFVVVVCRARWCGVVSRAMWDCFQSS